MCLATCFFATGHVGEFTVQRLDGFNPEAQVSRTQLSYDQTGNCAALTMHQGLPTRGRCMLGETRWAQGP